MKNYQTKSLSDLNLLIHNGEYCFWDGHEYYSQFSWGKFGSAFAQYFKEIFYAVPVREKKDGDIGIMIGGRNITFIPLPFYDSMASFIRILPRNFFKIKKIVKKSVNNSNIIFLRLPSLCAFLYFFYAKKSKKPVINYIAGNVLKASAPIIKGSLLKKILARFIAYAIHIINRLIVNRSLVTFVKGNELLQLYKAKDNRIFPLIISIIKKDLIFEGRDDTCQYQPIKLLAVVRVIPTKGIEYLIESMNYLNKENYNIQLNIVGKADNLSYLMELKSLLTKYQINSKVIFRGYVPFGEDLFQLYRDADISVVPSLSEGSPRTIPESWAFGLPLVATKVGGIPDIVINEENGLLISPKSAQEIYRTVKRIIDNGDLRKKLIRNGIEFAKNHTKEKQILYMIKIIEEQLYHHSTNK